VKLDLALLGLLSAERGTLERAELLGQLVEAGVAAPDARRTLERLLAAGLVRGERTIQLTSAGVAHFLDLHARIEAALGAPPSEDCPSVPWLTLVQTCWVDAISVNYAVDPRLLAAMLPAPLEPEIWKGTAWVQVLMSSLRDMRPQGMPSLFGWCFYQVSYRAAVQYRDQDGQLQRGGYFVRADTNHPVMRAVGLSLNEFRFHEFGECEMMMIRDGDTLTVGSDPAPGFEGGKLVGVLNTQDRSERPPEGSVWASLDELHQPLVECYDAFGVDRDNGWLYVLGIERAPWNARFVRLDSWYCELFDTGPLAGSRLDHVLHITECAYRWMPLRRVRLATTGG
jgi:uncharacterized protein YqjF (DUF2071 family)